MRRLLLILIFNFLYYMQNVYANEVLGCGGFIKSHADIDFSKVELKLLTKQGALKDKTDCSPSNGYYFLPIYDKGEYLLRISPPPGWSFEPEELHLNFDGKTDICSQGKDLNFVFKGFGITGKVTLADGKFSGVSGVEVQLRNTDGTDVRTTRSDINGIFSFSPVIPGKYTVRAQHATWYFSKSELDVLVSTGNTELPQDSLVVAGFDVVGKFDLTDQQITGIGIALFKAKSNNVALKCGKGKVVPLVNKHDNFESTSACFAKVEAGNAYKFNAVAPGKYLIQPVLESTKLKLNIEPKYLEFEVKNDAVRVQDVFKITGIDLTGKVLNAPDGSPLANAVVKLNEKIVAKTNEKGTYMLQNVKATTYTLQVELPQYQFNELSLNLYLATAALPDVVPNAYEVCGKVLSKRAHVLEFTKPGHPFQTTSTSSPESGIWCTFLPTGKYNVQVLISDADKASGVQFYPVKQQIEVKNSPVSGITFSQLRATLRGEIKCLSDAPADCTGAEITLHTIDATGQITGQKHTTFAQNGHYEFKEILPGPYEITIPQNGLCFDSTRVLINIATAKETAPTFNQLGYEVSIVASHRAILKYSLVAPVEEEASKTAATHIPPPTETLKILSGVNTFCVNKFGTYNFNLEGCHLFDENLPKTFTTNIDGAANNAIIITAVAHKVGVRVLSTETNTHSLQLVVESNTLGKQVVKPVAESFKVDGKYAYRFDTYLKAGEILKVTPTSDALLFNPQTKDIIGPEDCIDIAFNFIAIRGLTLRGKVEPAIKDVRITLAFPENGELTSQTVNTNDAGEFKFGPIDEKIHYKLTAEKESYVFSEFNKQTETFSAHKLCEVIVNVKTESGKPLSGVLLSLSGAESYRKNLVTADNGDMSFHSLSPSQYFLRPMMKEYKFEPNSKMIDMKDGETVEVELVAKRVAYSVFGTVTSLNGEPFPQVNLEATAEASCMHHQEEATSEPNGQYRIRGLQPGCEYTIRSKSIGDASSYVERTVPAEHNVKIAHDDVRNINLIAISPISVLDVTVRVTASLNDHYKTLRLVMYRKDSPDLHIYSQRVDTPLNLKSRYNPGIMVFPPRLPLDGKTYVIELRTTLSDKTYTLKRTVVEFVANISSIFLELDFKPEVRVTEHDMNHNSLSALFLVALVVIAFFKQDIAMDCLNFVWGHVNKLIQDFAQRQKNNQANVRRVEPLNKRELEQMAEQINATKKKKTKKI